MVGELGIIANTQHYRHYKIIYIDFPSSTVSRF